VAFVVEEIRLCNNHLVHITGLKQNAKKLIFCLMTLRSRCPLLPF